MTFGDKLKKYREEHGISQEQLGAILGTSKQVISRYEKGQRSPQLDTVQSYPASSVSPSCISQTILATALWSKRIIVLLPCKTLFGDGFQACLTVRLRLCLSC